MVTTSKITAALGLAVLGLAVSARGSDIVFNGSFELPAIPDGFATIPTAPVPDGWNVAGAPAGSPLVTSIDQIHTYWQPASDGGTQSLDMNGLNQGVIGQTLTVTQGETYFLQFAMSGNPAGGPPVKTLQVDVIPLAAPNITPVTLPFATTGTDPGSANPIALAGVTDVDYQSVFSYDIATEQNTLTDMKWVWDGVSFTATSSSVYLQFTSRTVDPSGNNSYPYAFGPALDAVSVVPVPLPAAVGVGFGMLGGFGSLFGLRKRFARRRRIA